MNKKGSFSRTYYIIGMILCLAFIVFILVNNSGTLTVNNKQVPLSSSNKLIFAGVGLIAFLILLFIFIYQERKNRMMSQGEYDRTGADTAIETVVKVGGYAGRARSIGQFITSSIMIVVGLALIIFSLISSSASAFLYIGIFVLVIGVIWLIAAFISWNVSKPQMQGQAY